MKNKTKSEITKELEDMELQLKFFEATEAWLKRIKETCEILKGIILGNYEVKIRTHANALLTRYIMIWDENY